MKNYNITNKNGWLLILTILAVLISIFSLTSPMKSQAQGFKYDEVCCGEQCNPNRCLNYGAYNCCIDVTPDN